MFSLEDTCKRQTSTHLPLNHHEDFSLEVRQIPRRDVDSRGEVVRITHVGAVAQLGARLNGIQEVASSILASSTSSAGGFIGILRSAGNRYNGTGNGPLAPRATRSARGAVLSHLYTRTSCHTFFSFRIRSRITPRSRTSRSDRIRYTGTMKIRDLEITAHVHLLGRGAVAPPRLPRTRHLGHSARRTHLLRSHPRRPHLRLAPLDRATAPTGHHLRPVVPSEARLRLGPASRHFKGSGNWGCYNRQD